MTEATIVELLREEAERTGDQDFSEAASLIERHQQVIDLLMKAVEPFSGVVTYEHLCRVREAKVEAERILNHSHPGLEREDR